MRRRDDHLHPFAEEGPEARPRLHHGVPVLGLLVAAHLSVIDYLGALDWRGHKQTKDWYAVMKSRPCFRPLLGERMEVIVPPSHYDKVDF